MPVPQWFEDRLAWKKASTRASLRCINYFGVPYGPNLADLSGTSSTRIAGEVYRLLDIPVDKVTDLDLSSIEALKELQTDDEVGARARARASNNELIAAGTQLEADLEIDIHEGLIARDPDRGWYVTRHGRVSQFAQYQHLEELQKLFESNPTLKTTVGRDYQVSTDVMVGLPNQWAGGPEHVLHAAVSSKLTLRSDRAQNVRVEFGTLVRNRRGRLPHLVVVTAEPLPSRIVSLGRGTGEVDAVYHLLFDEISAALDDLRKVDRHLRSQWQDWDELVQMARLRPYSELADVLATG